MRKKPEHPIYTMRQENEELREENRWLVKALFFTEVLAAGFFGAFLAVMSVAEWL